MFKSTKTAVISDALTKSWQSFGSAPGFNYKYIDGVHLFKSFVKTHSFNYAYAENEVGIETVAKVVDYFGSIPFVWVVDKSQTSLKKALQDIGFFYEDNMQGMILNLEKKQAYEIKNGIEIQTVDSDKLLASWADVLSRGFDLPKEDVWIFAENIFPLQDQRLFVAYHDKTPSAVCMVSFCRRTALLSFVTTLPGKRRLGLGWAISATALEYAKNAGCTTAALHSSKMGENVYSSLGFENIGGYELWITKNIDTIT